MPVKVTENPATKLANQCQSILAVIRVQPVLCDRQMESALTATPPSPVPSAHFQVLKSFGVLEVKNILQT